MTKTEPEYVHYTWFNLKPSWGYMLDDKDRADYIQASISCLVKLVNRHNKSYPGRFIRPEDLYTLRSFIRMACFPQQEDFYVKMT